MKPSASTIQQPQRTYSVGGVKLPRPFQIRRLGHFGYNVRDLQACLKFYRDVLGFRISDPIDFRPMIDDVAVKAALGEHSGYFMRHSGDHHSFVLFDKRAMDARRPNNPFPEVLVNQITWQVNSLEEVVDAARYFEDKDVPRLRSGRDTPGSNWHTYGFDPDGHIVEVYYGIEQIGWDGYSKPRSMYDRGFREVPPLPQICEQEEVIAALDKKISPADGYVDRGVDVAKYEVQGILLPRPFVVTAIGPLKLFVGDVEVASRFYRERLGLSVTEERSVEGCRATFLRAGGEHHSIALFDIALRERLGVRADSTTLSFGVRVGSYAQLRAAAAWLTAAGARRVDLPSEISPGLRYSVFFEDPDNHLVELYSEMDQVGWDGRVREPSLLPNRDVQTWPESIEPVGSTFLGEPFFGPML
ncbi:catechol-2,3-dioxygenase [Paraburkholderia sp. BL23I1N1]|uniref:VOC family protein n=1 Tax=Paraburkholderia sp. BL23I1N1 TaxID=1938802 RepID=UPI000E7576A9|nr:VOC family protein [Paraburkholderia sp. BL23I1N1]RKE38576.1 catechol-2,3-dioxygenase [Paraburkholderia sp. BL23I1N1]